MKYVALFIILSLIGVFFIGQGITGFVVSQSCCFPPDCSEENVCSVHYPQPASIYPPLFIGALIIIIFTFLVYHRIREKRDLTISEIFVDLKQNG